MKRTKIVATIGPSSSDYKSILKMTKAGMDVCRLNFSHNSHQSHLDLIKNIKKVRQELNVPLTILQDLQGPKLRVADVGDGGIRIEKGEEIVLVDKKIINYNLLVGSRNKIIPVDFDISHMIKINSRILIHDGLIELKVSKIDKNLVWCKVYTPGIIFSHKGVNIPGAKITNNILTKKDKEDLKFGLRQKVDWIALSFVRDPADIKNLKKLIKKYDPKSKVKIMAKIERPEAVKKINKIINEVDGIMIARGDLGVEIDIEKVPIVQKDIITKCMKLGKPVVVATQMLESMVENLRPTRAEVSDVANAVIDHTDAVMLSGETAYGKYPVETIEMMSKIIKKVEASPYDDVTDVNLFSKLEEILAIPKSVQSLVLNTKAEAIIVATNSGYSARMISSLRPETKIIALVNDEIVKRQLNISWGVYSLNMPKCKYVSEIIDKSIKLSKKNKLIKKGDSIVIVTGQPVGLKENMNLVKLHQVE
ncbi:pyruvate kinase [bacterium]|nr:pyruvate kinase [bacterium]